MAGSPIEYPTETVKASNIFPDLDEYVGLPLDLGRMEATISDSSVQQQFGMRVGIPDAGQLNALETLNIRGERSVTCKGAFDAHPSTGPLPAGAPEGCEEFRQMPDALERAAELDSQYGNKPPLDELPMYCIPFAFKDPIDTKDMRTTANADVNYAMDVPPFDSTVVAELRTKGAIVYAKAQATEYNFGPGNPGGPASLQKSFFGSHSLSTWSGEACNPYDTERDVEASSSGSGVAVSANLVACSFCEQSFGSCKGPAGRNGVVSILTTNNIIQGAGGFPNQFTSDRLGIMCRSVGDGALVLDALKNPERGYFDPRDIYTALPNVIIADKPYSSFVVDDKDAKGKPLAGMRIGIVREFMVKFVPNDAAISDQINDQIKTILRDKLGAELVESVDPLYPDDPDVPNMEYTFQDGLAETLPRYNPEFLLKKTFSGALEFAVPGHDVTSYDYMLKLSKGLAPLSDNLNLRRVQHGILEQNSLTTKFDIERYLIDRGDETVKDWASLFTNAKWNRDEMRRNGENWVHADTIVSDGKTERILMREVARVAILKVMHENDIDLLVNPENTFPPTKLGGPSDTRGAGFFIFGGGGTYPRITATVGFPEIIVPAGFNQIVYEPNFVLSSDKKSYGSVAGTEESLLPNPMPIGIMFWAGPGDEPALIKIASAYEAATHHRVPPPDFGPLDEDGNPINAATAGEPREIPKEPKVKAKDQEQN
jgi:Asp-tRNA(Asn)/Glu-tRNA(Gln) amidotransferase A subunit family amidase